MAYKKKVNVGHGLRLAVILFVLIASVGSFIWAMFDEFIDEDGKSHHCVADTINATVAQDGSLHVVDSRTYEFKGSYTLTAAVLDPPSNGTAIINSVSVTDAAGQTTQLTQVPFDKTWRKTGGPPSGYFAIDSDRKTIYAFSSTTDATKTFTFDYTYTNAVIEYTDVSVLYWQFIGPKWDVDTKNINAYVHLPVPEGQSVEGGKNVYAFGHGATDGTVSFSSDGVIDFAVPKTKSGTFAEMRVAFPATWTPAIEASLIQHVKMLPTIIEEERTWQLETQQRRLMSILMLAIPLLVSLVCIVLAIVFFFRFGREHKPEFMGEYWRDVPEKGTNPAVIARLWRWNENNANDLVAVLMHLSKLGVIELSRDSYMQDRKILPDKEQAVYTLTLNRQKAETAELDPIDRETIKFVFDTVAGGNDTITLEEIESYAKSNAKKYVAGLSQWQKRVDTAVNLRNFFESAGERCKALYILVAVILLFIGFGISMYTENFIPLLGLLPGIIVLFIFSFFMRRRSREAVEIYARSKALEHWFKDFTNLKEAIPTDAKVWGELLVYAYIFGVMDQVVSDLNKMAPEVFEQEGAFPGGSIWWYYNPYGRIGHAAASGDFFGNAFDNTLSTARDIIASANSGGGGGFGGFGGGGGFSGGGGGGFGGGGGGFSR